MTVQGEGPEEGLAAYAVECSMASFSRMLLWIRIDLEAGRTSDARVVKFGADDRWFAN